MNNKNITVSQFHNIGRIANLAISAGVPVNGWRIGNAVCNGAFAAVVCIEAANMLQHNPPNKQEVQDAYNAALEFLNAAGILECS